MMRWTRDRLTLEVWRLPNGLRWFGLIEIYHYEI